MLGRRSREEGKPDEKLCSFCHEGEGSDSEDDDPIIDTGALIRGRPVYAHEECLFWCPDAWQGDDMSWQNVSKSLNRCHRLKCAECGEGDAPLGCKRKACKKNWHYPCARSAADRDELIIYEDEYCVACPVRARAASTRTTRCRSATLAVARPPPPPPTLTPVQ